MTDKGGLYPLPPQNSSRGTWGLWVTSQRSVTVHTQGHLQAAWIKQTQPINRGKAFIMRKVRFGQKVQPQRPGIKSMSSWILVGFITHWSTMGTPSAGFRHGRKRNQMHGLGGAWFTHPQPGDWHGAPAQRALHLHPHNRDHFILPPDPTVGDRGES